MSVGHPRPQLLVQLERFGHEGPPPAHPVAEFLVEGVEAHHERLAPLFQSAPHDRADTGVHANKAVCVVAQPTRRRRQ
jgi:hypothetical protein